MAKAKIEKPNGTIITIDGSVEEVEYLINNYEPDVESEKEPKKPLPKRDDTEKDSRPTTSISLSDIVNMIKTCDEAEEIELNILDQPSEVNRVLLPLYIVYKYMNNDFPLTTIDIANITADLGIRVLRQNAYRSLTGSGSSYVITDNVRKHGVATKYKLNRRGEKYLHSVIHGNSDGE